METPLSLIIFDCDGVLVDSETIINGVVARALTALGWPMNAVQSQALFLGMSLSDMKPVIEAKIGRTLPQAWAADISERTAAALADGVPLIPGAFAVLQELNQLGVPFRVASNSSRPEMAMKLARTGLDKIIDPSHVHCATDMIEIGKRGKPAPDLYLAAAEAEGVHPDYCLVVEDSAVGARAAAAAGMECLGFAPHGKADSLIAEGARPIRDLTAILPLVRSRMLIAA